MHLVRGRARSTAIAAIILTTGALSIGAAVAATSGPAQREAPKAGGTYRVGWESSFGFTNHFDPTGEYLGDAMGIYSNLLIRTLVGYNHVAGPAGNKLVPDLATSVPTPGNGGRTYTFHLKPGVKFGPPLDRAVTSKDVAYSFERLANPKNGGQYAFYYDVIRGFGAFAAGKAKTISGISTPNSRTIVFTLTRPTGDFLYRVSMPATGPLPREVAGCFDGRPGEYGRYLVSTGPYMIAGANEVDASSCAKLKPMSGFDGETSLSLVRNPSYVRATDSLAARSNRPDEFRFTTNSNAGDILDKVTAGELDDELPGPSARGIRRYMTDPDLRQYVHTNSGDRTFYLTMNLTQPPFDDVRVRRAMNWIMDKPGLIQAWGGPTVGKVANHIVPDTMLNNQLAEFAPYKTPGDRGNLAKARLAMKGSKYDTAGDGTCSDPLCKNVLVISADLEVSTKMLPVIQASAAKIGITFFVRTLANPFPAIQTTSNNVPFAAFTGWGKDYADPVTFFSPLFSGRTIIPNGNTNYSLVGLTTAAAKKLGVTGSIANVPSVDSHLDRCAAAVGAARLACYKNLDKHLMTKVVPWVPYLWATTVHITSSKVTRWQYDQFSGGTAYAHVAVS